MGLISPACWPCQHFSSVCPPADGVLPPHFCDLGLPGFPRIGARCPSYCYEPGADYPDREAPR